MRKKICIATPVDYGNFGNRLQNYAVHMICKKMGMEPVTLAVEYSFVCGKIPKHRILELIHTFHIGNLISKANRLKSINKSYASWLFTKETIKTVYVENQDELNRMLTQSAYFGIGGDQIFAPYWNEIVWFSMFPECDPNSKICFSPSFGTDSPDRDYLNKIKPELLEIGNLAVREESGCRIAKDLTGKNVHRICDPVVMLSKADWIRAVARKEVSQKETISLVYFLGEYQENYFPKVENEAQKNGWCVIDVSRSSKSISLWDSCDSAAWDKLYKVKLFKGRRYPFGVLHEDLNFTSKLFSESDKIVLTGMPLYNYLIRENSICNKPFTTQKFDIYEQAKLNCQFVRDTYKELEEKAKYFLFRCTCTLLQSASDAAQISEKDLKRVKELARTQLSTAILNRFVPLGERKYYFELLYKVCIKKK